MRWYGALKFLSFFYIFITKLFFSFNVPNLRTKDCRNCVWKSVKRVFRVLRCCKPTRCRDCRRPMTQDDNVHRNWNDPGVSSLKTLKEENKKKVLVISRLNRFKRCFIIFSQTHYQTGQQNHADKTKCRSNDHDHDVSAVRFFVIDFFFFLLFIFFFLFFKLETFNLQVIEKNQNQNQTEIIFW